LQTSGRLGFLSQFTATRYLGSTVYSP
jgi:hypothetical protein